MIKFEFTMSDVDAENLLRAIRDHAASYTEEIMDVMVDKGLTKDEQKTYISAYKDVREYYLALIPQMKNYRVENDSN